MANADVVTWSEYLKQVEPALRPICQRIREIVVELHPEFVEIIWIKQGIASYGVGPKKMSEHYVYIAPQTAHVNLGFYHGASLDDADGVLEGTGKAMRHVKVRSVEDVDEDRIRVLIDDAIRERRD